MTLFVRLAACNISITQAVIHQMALDVANAIAEQDKRENTCYTRIYVQFIEIPGFDKNDINIRDIIRMYIETHGTDKVSNKKYHKYLKAIRDSIQWEKEPVEFQLGDQVLRVYQYPDLYWQLHLHGWRKEIIQRIENHKYLSPFHILTSNGA